MELSDFYPPPSKLLNSELSVLGYLRSNPYIKAAHPQVALEAGNYYARNKRSHSGFEFHSHFDIWHVSMNRKGAAPDRKRRPAPNARLMLSARIELKDGAFANVTYCLAVCRIRSRTLSASLPILRKFHFDVTARGKGVPPHLQEHPRCHLQYCGEMVPYMATIGCRQAQLDQMHPWLSEPRIFFWPMSLALLVDLALHEFPDQDSAKFRADGYWRGLVREQEALVLRPFYERCVEVIKDTKGKNQTLADAFYV